MGLMSLDSVRRFHGMQTCHKQPPRPLSVPTGIGMIFFSVCLASPSRLYNLKCICRIWLALIE
jgi:hypothetical protein